MLKFPMLGQCLLNQMVDLHNIILASLTSYDNQLQLLLIN